MRTLKRNQLPIWYCQYSGETELTDTDGNYTGEHGPSYLPPVKLMANVSPATGYSNNEMFGNLTDYDRVVVTDKIDVPIDENTVLFFGKTPDDPMSADGYNYIVRRVAKSLNSVAIAIQKVDVTPPVRE